MGTCEGIEQQAKSTYGEDYLEQLKANPQYMSAALSQIVSNNCKSYFNYSSLTNEFCGDHNNILAGIGGGQTCKDLDTTGSRMATWCLAKESPSDSKPRMRARTDACNQAGLKSKYNDTAATYCTNYPGDDWCKCYNLVNHGNVCSKNVDAAGCKEAKNIEDNKDFFKDGYDILKDKHHCRPRACNRPNINYIPQGALDSCETSYTICGKDIDIRNASNSDIVLKCNEGMSERELPTWWNEEDEGDQWWLDEGRKPPFDRFPLNKLPITEFPDEFDWEDDNVKYLTYASVSSVILCCCCMILLMAMTKK